MLVSVQPLSATTYYVSNTGDDGNLGTGPGDDLAWATTSKVTSELTAGNVGPGDTVLFKSGHRWSERLLIRNSGTAGNVITFSSYGSGDMPIIGDFDEYPSWSSHTYNHVYTANVTTEPYYVNEYLPSSEAAPTAGYFRLYFKESSVEGVRDREGSFYWSSNTLYVHCFDDTDLTSVSNTKEIYGNTTILSRTVSLTNEDYITIDSLHLACADAGIYSLRNANEITVQNCRLSGLRQAINTTYGGPGDENSDWYIHDNDFRYCGNGVKIHATDNVYVYDNRFIDNLHEWADADDSEAVAPNHCSNIHVYRNHFTDTGVAFSIFVRDNPESNFYFYQNLVDGISNKGVDTWRDEKLDGDFHIYHNVFWMDLTKVTKAINLYAEKHDDNGTREPYQIWNNTIRAHTGITTGVGDDDDLENYPHHRCDYVAKNNIFTDCKYFWNDRDESIVEGSSAVRDYNCYYPELDETVGSENKIIYNGVTYDDSHSDDEWTDYLDTCSCDGNSFPGYENGASCSIDFKSAGTNWRVETTSDCHEAGLTDGNEAPFNVCPAEDYYEQDAWTLSIGAAEESADTGECES